MGRMRGQDFRNELKTCEGDMRKIFLLLRISLKVFRVFMLELPSTYGDIYGPWFATSFIAIEVCIVSFKR